MTKIVGLTGGIGAGKSKILSVFENFGVPCYNSDIEAKNSDDLLGSSEEDQEDDDLEIPAFLRRQKN